jgi:hypothetical protein
VFASSVVVRRFRVRWSSTVPRSAASQAPEDVEGGEGEDFSGAKARWAKQKVAARK